MVYWAALNNILDRVVSNPEISQNPCLTSTIYKSEAQSGPREFP